MDDREPLRGPPGDAVVTGPDQRLGRPARRSDRPSPEQAARRLLRRFHWVMLGAWFADVLLLASEPAGGAGWVIEGLLVAVVAAAAAGLGAAGWRLRAGPGPVVGPRLRRLPLEDRLVGTWLALDLVALIALGCIPAVPSNPGGTRFALSGLAFLCLVVAWASALLTSRSDGRAAAGPG